MGHCSRHIVTMKIGTVFFIFIQFWFCYGQEDPKPESREVEPGVYAFTVTGAYISMYVITSDGVMVIDPI